MKLLFYVIPVFIVLLPIGSRAALTQTKNRSIGKSAEANHRPPSIPHKLPDEQEDGPANGLTLDAAIKRLLAANYELAVEFQDIPKARADILSAGIIENPSVFLNTEGVPYGNYSPKKPGETDYEVTVTQPFDFSGKRRRRIRVARRAERTLEALYQDEIRQEIDKLYRAYVDFLQARLEVRNAQNAFDALTRLTTVERGLVNVSNRPASDAGEAVLRRADAETALGEAKSTLLQARRRIASLLAVPADRADRLPLRGSLHDCSPPPPPVEDLIRTALQVRPDLAAYELSVQHAQADVKLTLAERFDDVLLFYTPYQGTTFPSQGEHTATGWEAGGLAALPIFDRKQGEIVRDKVSVAQLEIQRDGLRRQIVHEVRRAATEYADSRSTVRRYEQDILPDAHAMRDEISRRFAEGKESSDSVLSFEKEYQETVRGYKEALVRHRRAMFRLNTVVGQRILP